MYSHLTYEQRYHIYVSRKAGRRQSVIAQELNLSRSTISRELKRNLGKKGYRPKQAHNLALNRRFNAKKAVKMTSDLKQKIDEKIYLQWSPEQVSAYIKMTFRTTISHERIYQYIAEDKKMGGNLYRHLRHGNKKRKKRYGSKDTRGQIKNRISIEHRPTIVDTKERIGDWEVDTVSGKNHKGFLVTAVERKSKITRTAYVERKTAKEVSDALIAMLKPLKNWVCTITADNGKEFAQHEKISTALGAQFFFAHPYASWERGLNENTNGLLRQYFPKKSNFQTIAKQHLDSILRKLNERPRKSLGFLTPNQVFLSYTKEVNLYV